ncbi:hypothetical protein [Nocardia xishanensis]
MPVLVYVLAAWIFLMGTTEFMIVGLLPNVDLGVDIARAGLLVTAFAVEMIIGPPVMALATLRQHAEPTRPTPRPPRLGRLLPRRRLPHPRPGES